MTSSRVLTTICLAFTLAWPSAASEKMAFRLTDLRPGTTFSSHFDQPAGLLPFKDIVLFSLRSQRDGTFELWRTDGTSGGTSRVIDFRAELGTMPRSPLCLTRFQGAVFFAVGNRLWRTDGTAAETRPVAEIGPPPTAPLERKCVATDDHLYITSAHRLLPATFLLPDPTPYFDEPLQRSLGGELWKSDGTMSGTTRIWFSETPSDRGIDSLEAVAEQVYFAENGRLWVSDGTAQGTVRRDLEAMPVHPLANAMLLADGSHLWIGDGTHAGSALLTGLLPGSPICFVRRGPVAYFGAGDELWRTDGTPGGTRSLGRWPRTLCPRGFLDDELVVSYGSTRIHAYDVETNGSYLLLSTGAHTTAVAQFDDEMLVALVSPTGHGELVSLDGSTAPARTILEDSSTESGASSLFRELADVAGTLYFTDVPPPYGPLGPTPRRLWKTEGHGVEKLDIPSPRGLVSIDDTLLLYASGFTAISGSTLESSQSGGNVYFSSMGQVGEKAFYMFNDPGELFVFGPSQPPQRLTLLETLVRDWRVTDDLLFFTTSDTYSEEDLNRGSDLWRSDGTQSGTFPLQSAPSPVRLLGGQRQLMFLSRDDRGHTLWSSDGTETGTQPVIDLGAGTYPTVDRFDLSDSVVESSLLQVSVGDLTYFLFQPAAAETQIWRTNGTASGTFPIFPGESHGSFVDPTELTAFRGQLYFVAQDLDHGVELWKSDGSPEGTEVAVDVRQGLRSAGPSELTPIGNTLLFRAYDEEAGFELWQSDGTMEGTFRAQDINPGIADSDPSSFTPSGQLVYFRATDNEAGEELWALDRTALSSHFLSLQEGRFEVGVSWTDNDGTIGRGTPLTFSQDTGFFWFFDRENPELMIKVLGGRPINGSFWVFYGALTHLELEITVRDLDTGEERTFNKPLGSLCGDNDTGAFQAAAVANRARRSHSFDFRPPSSAISSRGSNAGLCVPSATALCLQENRFRVEVAFEDPHDSGIERRGFSVPRSNQSGAFWFFAADNLELLVKVLDGTSINGHHWVFYSGLTDLEYQVTITDTLIGSTQVYHSDAGTLCGSADTEAF